MAWTETTRRQYERQTSRYASDVTDREWGFIAGFMPAPRRLGRPRKTDVHGGEKTIQWSACVCAGAGGVKVGHWIG